MSGSFSVEDVDAQYQPTMTRAMVCMKAELVLEIERLEEQLDAARRSDAKQNRAPLAPAIAERIVDLQAEARKSEVEFVFRSVGRYAFRDLIQKHPATPEQLRAAEEAGMVAQFDPEAFPPALMAASCVQPTGSTLSWWQAKWAEWAPGQISRIWAACLAAHQGVTEIPKAADAYALTNGSGPKSD